MAENTSAGGTLASLDASFSDSSCRSTSGVVAGLEGAAEALLEME